jgi:hypothetical protein
VKRIVEKGSSKNDPLDNKNLFLVPFSKFKLSHLTL